MKVYRKYYNAKQQLWPFIARKVPPAKHKQVAPRMNALEPSYVQIVAQMVAEGLKAQCGLYAWILRHLSQQCQDKYLERVFSVIPDCAGQLAHQLNEKFTPTDWCELAKRHEWLLEAKFCRSRMDFWELDERTAQATNEVNLLYISVQ